MTENPARLFWTTGAQNAILFMVLTFDQSAGGTITDSRAMEWLNLSD